MRNVSPPDSELRCFGVCTSSADLGVGVEALGSPRYWRPQGVGEKGRVGVDDVGGGELTLPLDCRDVRPLLTEEDGMAADVTGVADEEAEAAAAACEAEYIATH